MSTYKDADEPIEIDLHLDELIEKGRDGTVKNIDFTKIWCNVALLPAYRIEYIITSSAHTRAGYNRDEAVIYGLLVRLFKLLCFQRRIVCKQLTTTTLAAFFERMILEGIVNIEYFIKNFDEHLLNNFRLNSLKAEAFFEEAIREDIAKNAGQSSDWQERLLGSIYDTYKKTNSSYEEVRSTKIKLPPISEKFRSTGNQKLYDVSYRTKCHDIHGDWVDLALNYLTFDNEASRFSPNFQEFQADIRQLNPPLIICCEMLKKFLRDFSGHELPHSLYDEINEDQRIILFLDKMHFNFVNKRDLFDGIDTSFYES